MVWPFQKKHKYDAVKTSIGNVLRDMGLITEQQLERAAAAHIADETRIGEALIAQKAITREQLRQALAVQDKLRTDGKEALGHMDILRSQVQRRHSTSTSMQALHTTP